MAVSRSLRRRARNPWARRLKRTGVFVGTAFGLIVSAGLVVFIPIKQKATDDAQHIGELLVVHDQNPTVVLSADKKILFSAAAIRRKVIDLNDPKYPSYIRYALVAAEDRRFFDHQGVDFIGLGRVAFTAVRDRRAGQGGSTISMQLAKLLINGDSRTLRRKLEDIATAQEIENLKSKDEILNLYANYVYYGQQAWGIERAAEVYFNKTADKLTVGEAAMLARSVRLPGRVNPVKTPDKMLDLRNYVLNVMREENWITQGQYDAGILEVPKVAHQRSYGQSKLVEPDAGYFVQHVLSQFEADNPGVDYRAGGYTIQTTLNMALQHKAVAAVRDVLAENRGHKVNDGAIVVMDQFGHILAEVGGPDFAHRPFNVITQGKRQPGSAFKAFVYTVALKNNVYGLNSYISNARISIPKGNGTNWEPQNASLRENASGYSMMDAFAHSVNRPAIHTIIEEGPKKVVAAAHDIFGIQSELGANASLALGTSEVKPLEMLEAYSVFMLGGDRAEPQPMVRVSGPGDFDRKYDPVVHRGVLDKRTALAMDDLLKGPVEFGTATIAQAVQDARGKTGTTNAAKDAWFCGYSDGLVGVGWVGNSSKNGHALPMSSSVFGGTVTVKIWTAVMQAAHNLGLAKGVKASPGTSVTVAATPDEEPTVQAVHDDGDDSSRHDPGVKVTPPSDPVEITPAPDKKPDAPPSTDPQDPAKNDGSPDKSPPLTDPDAVDPPDSAKDQDPPRRPRPAKRKDEATESVEICVDTGLRANDYCPETVTRTFPKGRAPKKVCNLHHG